MKWSWKLGHVGGIALYIHFTFLLFLGWLFLARYFTNHDIEDAVEELVFVVLVFATVVLHELGHAFAARRFGIATRDITLYPIGGVARLERMPEDPAQELVVAIAGPLVNVVIALGLLLWLTPPKAFAALTNSSLQTGLLLPRLLMVNVFLVLFNLIPAFPMDGGRVLRALLAMQMDYVQATQAAAAVGQLVALVFGFVGLFGYPMLLFIALFVYMAAAQESGMVQVRAALAGIPVSKAMLHDIKTVAPGDTLQRATDLVLSGFQHDFPVVEDGRVVGVLTRGGLLTALAKQGESGVVGDAMQRRFETADPAEMLEQVLTRLQECECRSMPVVRNGQLVGLVTMDNLGELLSINSALRQSRRVASEPRPSGSGSITPAP